MDGETPKEIGLRAALRLKNIELARAKVELWRERSNHSAHMVEFSLKQQEAAEAISEGRDYQSLLTAVCDVVKEVRANGVSGISNHAMNALFRHAKETDDGV